MSKLDRVKVRRLDQIRPSPENDAIYGALSADDPAVIDLALSIQKVGVQLPLLVSRDGYIISGHRRHFAARLAGLDHVPVLISSVGREEQSEFLELLVGCNSQRIKSTGVLLREAMLKVDPQEAYQRVVNDRKEKEAGRNGDNLSAIDPLDDGQRCAISQAKVPFLQAIRRVLTEQRQYWPLSDRQIHYRLLGEDAPLIHASKPDSRYVNNKASYRALTDLLARGRVAGVIPWEAIEDSTRPSDLSAAFWSTAEFFRQEFNNFLKGYWRDRLQSQPHHIEIVAEKLTVRTILQEVAKEHTMHLTISRGMASLPPKKAIYDRYKRSKKDQLILLVVSDLDPAGDCIAEDLVKSFRRDFLIPDAKLKAYKVALTIDQVREFELMPSMDAKESSPTYDAFVDRYGITDAYELEALDPADLAKLLDSAITDVLDIDEYNQQLAAEEEDSTQIIALQRQVRAFFDLLEIETNEEPEE